MGGATATVSDGPWASGTWPWASVRSSPRTRWFVLASAGGAAAAATGVAGAVASRFL